MRLKSTIQDPFSIFSHCTILSFLLEEGILFTPGRRREKRRRDGLPRSRENHARAVNSDLNVATSRVTRGRWQAHRRIAI